MAELIITNGDHAAELLRAAGRTATILPWRDILHEGPIVAGPLEVCSHQRAVFLAERFGVAETEIAADFADRDATLRKHRDFDRIELWFEHDLYDQLQLLQVLAAFAAEERSEGVVLVQADDFLGGQSPDTILKFAAGARAIDDDDLDTAERAWADLAMPTPEYVLHWSGVAEERLPFLGAALHRFLEELPAPGSGVTRSEAVTLADLAKGPASPSRLFRALIAEEEAAFMGDLSFFRLLDDLTFCDVPLISGLPAPGTTGDDSGRYRDASLALTLAGADVLGGRADHVVLNGIHRWWAGTRLDGHAAWRFDRETGDLLPPR